MNGHDEETYERKDLPTAFISREEHNRILYEYNNYKVQAYEQLIELDKLREALKELMRIAQKVKYTTDIYSEEFDKVFSAIENASKLIGQSPEAKPPHRQ